MTFLFLDGDMELILNRMRMRKGHFMKENMVKSQFETLERPDNEPQTLIISIDGYISDVVERSAAELIKMQAIEVA